MHSNCERTCLVLVPPPPKNNGDLEEVDDRHAISTLGSKQAYLTFASRNIFWKRCEKILVSHETLPVSKRPMGFLIGLGKRLLIH